MGMNSSGKHLYWVMTLIAAASALTAALCFLQFDGGETVERAVYAEDTADKDSEVCGSYQPIFDRNKKMLENITEYGDEYCVGYVSTSDDPERHRQTLEKLRELSEEICKGAKNDLEKVQKMELWTADNLYYNFDAAKTSVTAEVISLENVLKTRTATCAGFSNMFSALCNMQGIYCVNLRGGTYVKEETPDNLTDIPMNHEWNAVRIDGEWLFIDTTWLSNNMYQNGEYIRSETMDTQYLDMDFENMCYEHRIDIADYRDFASSINYFEREN